MRKLFIPSTTTVSNWTPSIEYASNFLKPQGVSYADISLKKNKAKKRFTENKVSLRLNIFCDLTIQKKEH